MFNSIKDKIKMYFLSVELSNLEKKHQTYFKSEEYKQLTPEKKEEKHFFSYEYHEIKGDYDFIFTNTLLREARKYKIPIPYAGNGKDDEFWNEHHITQAKILSPKGFYELNNLIRTERKESRYDRLLWPIPIFSLGISIISLLFSLFNLWIQFQNK